MINALRHQRLVHTITTVAKDPSDIVINALRHQRLVHGQGLPSVSYSLRDQRLTASKVSTLALPNKISAIYSVINALRHQRLVHILGRSFFFSGFCDQRLTASKVSTLDKYRSFVKINRSVINALRHQRLVHLNRRLLLNSPLFVINALRHQRLVHK